MKRRMSKERKIVNTNIRLNLLEEEDRQAWEYLQNMDRKQYKSYSRAVVSAINGYFGHMQKIAEDPYLETRTKEDEFLQKVYEAVARGVSRDVNAVTQPAMPIQETVATAIKEAVVESMPTIITESMLLILQHTLRDLKEVK